MTIEKLPFSYALNDVNPRYRLLNQVADIFSDRQKDRNPPLLNLFAILKERFCSTCSLISIDEAQGAQESIYAQLKFNQDHGLGDYAVGYNSETDETFLGVSLPPTIKETLGDSYALVLWRKGRLFSAEDIITIRAALIVFFARYNEFRKTVISEAIEAEELLSFMTTTSEGQPLSANALSRLYEEALDMVCKVVVITEVDGRLLHLNRAAKALFQRTLETTEKEYGGIDWVAGILHPDDVSKLVNTWNQAQASVTGFHVEFRLQMNDEGQYHLFSCYARPFQLTEGTSEFNWIFVMYDTEQLRLMEETREAAARKTKFLAEMSHEIRTPLACVIGTCSLLSYTPLNREQSELLNTIRVSSQQLFTLTNNILDLAKIEESKLILESRVICLERMVTDVVDIFVPDLAKKDLDVCLNICFPEVPELIKSDEGRLRQIFTNILCNAIKFTAEHSTILINVRRVDGGCDSRAKLQFEISDEGPGIPDSIPQSQLFDTFVQLDASTSRKYGGSGLGLTISKKLVNLLGGEIWYESEVGKGTNMIFTVALKEPSTIELADPGLSSQTPSSFRLLRALREFLSTLRSSQPIVLGVLVRKPRVADYLTHLFHKAGNQVDICLLADGAIENENVLIAELIKLRPAIVISDVLRHTECMKKAIKEKICNAVIFADDQNHKITLPEDRQFHCLRKPIKPNALIKCVHELLLNIFAANESSAEVAAEPPGIQSPQSLWLPRPTDSSSSSGGATVQIPRLMRTVTPSAAASPAPPGTGTTSNFASTYPLHLMLAEDNLLNQQLMTRILCKYGYDDVLVADNGRQALEAFARLTVEGKCPIDAIFMDMQMPEVEGPEATHLIRSFCRKNGVKQPHVMALTARAFSEDRAECLRAGMCTYLSKPIRWSTLEEELIHAYQAINDKVRCVCNEDRLTDDTESSGIETGRSTGLDV